MNLRWLPRRTFVGSRVRLLRTLKTKGGDVFRRGRVMVLSDRWGAGFELRAIRGGKWIDTGEGSGHRVGWGIKDVRQCDFVIVEGI